MFTILPSIYRVFILSFRATKIILTNISTMNNQIIIITFSYVANMINSFIYLLIKTFYCQLQLPTPCCYAVEVKHQGNTFLKPNSIFVSFFSKTLGFDGITIFKCFIVIFSLKKKTIQFLLSLNLSFQQKRAPKLSICHLPTKRSVWVFDVTNRTNGFYNFQSYYQVVTYLFNSLAKSCTLFWKYS